MATYHGISSGYILQQEGRISASREQILDNREVKSGRVIPDPNAIRINDGRRLSISVLFLDICRFSSRLMCTESEQDREMRALAFFFAELMRIVRDHGGVVEKNTGDGLMAYFEDRDGINASQRVLSASLTMFRTAEKILNPQLEREGIDPYTFRICADTGELLIARIGVPRSFNSLVAVGTTANVTAKMLSKAQSGQLLVGARLASEIPEDWWVFLEWSNAIHSSFVYRNDITPYYYVPYTGRWSN